jgi:uncharacterized protein YbjQ (UPF0145 family)
MIVTTTNNIANARIVEYLGIVSGEVIIGTNVFADFFAKIRDFIGGRSGSYENVVKEGKEDAIEEMCKRAESLGANAIIGVNFDFGTIGAKNSMIMVACNGTAVKMAEDYA